MKYAVILFLSLCFISSTTAQVYFSNVLEDYVIFGPDNVTDKSEKVAAFYIEEINGAADQLKEFIKEGEKHIAQIRIGKVKRKEKIEIAKLEKDIEEIEFELEIYSEYLLNWENTSEQHLQIQDLFQYLSAHPEHCLELVTAQGTFNNDALNFILFEPEDPAISLEFINIKSSPGETMWVKKKADRNCLSADPNDCLVWCLVERDAGYSMLNSNIETKYFKACPFGFDLDPSQTKCHRQLTDVPKSMTFNHRITNLNNEQLDLINWRNITCD